MAYSTKNVTTESLKIHVLTEDIFNEINSSGAINENELYLVEGIDESSSGGNGSIIDPSTPVPLIAGGTGVSVNSVSELRSVLSVAAADHTSTDKSCGVGNATKFGHIKLTDNFSTASNADAGIAATPKAVKAVYDELKELVDSKADSTSVGTIASPLIGYGEVAEWSDGNRSEEDRIGYFVSSDVSKSTINIIKATSTSIIRGVTVEKPGFSTGAGDFKFDNDGKLLKRYTYVLTSGLVTVIDNGKCVVGKTCMSNDMGIAIPSTNDMGYQVVDRVDETHIMILMEPQANTMIRLRNDVDNKQDLLTWTTMEDIDAMIAGTYDPETVGGALATDDMVIFLARSEE